MDPALVIYDFYCIFVYCAGNSIKRLFNFIKSFVV